jgi:hypothetical protein
MISLDIFKIEDSNRKIKIIHTKRYQICNRKYQKPCQKPIMPKPMILRYPNSHPEDTKTIHKLG